MAYLIIVTREKTSLLYNYRPVALSKQCIIVPNCVGLICILCSLLYAFILV